MEDSSVELNCNIKLYQFEISQVSSIGCFFL